jgi:predicted amidohydrolase YtcJ
MAVTDALLIRDVEVDGKRYDCRIENGVVDALGSSLLASADTVTIDGHGGVLLPGLTDHHLHLFALASLADSVDLSAGLRVDDVVAAAERVRTTSEWVRVIGWDEPTHGHLDRDELDRLVDDVPVRVQHRSGALWILNSRAIDLLAESSPPAGAERDHAGRLTGLVWRGDEWLCGKDSHPPDLRGVGERLARLGITAVTDASPRLDAVARDAVDVAVREGVLPQRVQLLCAETGPTSDRVTVGPKKIVLGDHDLPAFDDFAAAVGTTHDAGRSVAIHCVSRAALALTIAALRQVGSRAGDRIEHCAIADETAIAALADLGVAVVTQPTLVAHRGDDYLDRHADDEAADLWRYQSLLGAGIRVVASSDAPYGDCDPWATMVAARDRRTPTGRILGPAERVEPAVVLAGMLAPVANLGGPSRRVLPGEPADLVLLRTSLKQALANPDARHVAVTVADGRLIYVADRGSDAMRHHTSGDSDRR